MPTHHYRITVDKVERPDALHPGGEGLESLSFFASTSHDIFAAAHTLRSRVECSACTAARLAVGISLLSEPVREHRGEALLTPLHRAALEVSESLESVAVGAATYAQGGQASLLSLDPRER